MNTQLAYYDTFAGLIPCRVLATLDNGRIDIKLTATRGAYKRGEVLTSVRHDDVVPRHRVYTRNYYRRIMGGWDWTTGEGCTRPAQSTTQGER